MSLENPNFEGQTTEGKIRDRCNIRRCTQIRAINTRVINNVEFRISVQNPYLNDQVIKAKSKIALIKVDVFASGLQRKYKPF